MYREFENISPFIYPELSPIVTSIINNPSLAQLKNPENDISIEELKLWVVKCALCSPIRNILKDYTPLQKAVYLSKKNNNTVYLKREECSPVYSFKLRGAFTKISALLSNIRQTPGVYTCSAGNHAQGVAYSARHYGVSSKIYMPVGAPSIKLESVKNFGGEILSVGETIDDCFQYAADIKDGRILIHPFDDLYVIAGQATAGLELMKQINLTSIDYLFVPCGGGGLVAGLGSVIKLISPKIKIIGVEALEAPGMTESLKNGEVTTLNKIGKFADGAAIRTVGTASFKLCQSLIDDMILVSTGEICHAICDTFRDIRMILEPAGALGVAGMSKFCADNNLINQNCLVLTTGANIDLNLMKFILENVSNPQDLNLNNQSIPFSPNTKTQLWNTNNHSSEILHTSNSIENLEHRFSIQLPEHPGSVKSLLSLLEPKNVTEIVYHHSLGIKKHSNMLLTLKVDSVDNSELISKFLSDKGYDPLEITNNKLAIYHARPSSFGGDSPKDNEIILRFEYNEGNKKTQKIFNELKDNWDLSRIHYQYSSEGSHLLLGIYTSQQSQSEINRFLNLIQSYDIEYSDETYNPLISRLSAF